MSHNRGQQKFEVVASTTADIIYVTSAGAAHSKAYKGTATLANGWNRVMVCKFKRNDKGYEYYEPCGSLVVQPITGDVQKHKLQWYGKSFDDCWIQGSLKVLPELDEDQEHVKDHVKDHAKDQNQFLAEYDKKMNEELEKKKLEYHGLMHSFIHDAKLCADYPAGHGIPDLAGLTGPEAVVVRQWTNAVKLARELAGFTNETDAYLCGASDPIKELVASAALVLLGGAYPHQEETVDDRAHPAWTLYTLEDCDGKAMSVVSFFHLLQATMQNLQSELGYDAATIASTRGYDEVAIVLGTYMANTFGEGCIVQCMVDPAAARGKVSLTPPGGNKDDSGLVGHVVAALVRKDCDKLSLCNAKIIDGTCVESHIGPIKCNSLNEAYVSTLCDDEVCNDKVYNDMASGRVIFKSRNACQAGIWGIRCTNPRVYKNMVSVYFKDRMCVVQPTPKECSVYYNAKKMTYECDNNLMNDLLNVDVPSKSRSVVALLSGKAVLVEMPKSNMFHAGVPRGVTETMPSMDLGMMEEFEQIVFSYVTRPEVTKVPTFSTLVHSQTTSAEKYARARVSAFCNWVYIKCAEYVYGDHAGG